MRAKNVYRLRAADEVPPPAAVPPVQSEPMPPAQTPRPFPRLGILRVRRWTMLWMTSFLMLLAAPIILLLPSTYVASTSVRLHDGDARAASLVDDQIQILTSTPFAEQTIRSLRLGRDGELTGGRQSNGLVSMILTTVGLRERAIGRTQGESIDPRLMERFASRLLVEPGDNPADIRISFVASSPTKAAELANAIAAVFLLDKTSVRPAAASTGHVDLVQLANRAQQDEEALAQYKNAFGEFTPTQTEPSGDRAQEVERARAALATEESKARQINALLRSSGAEAVIAKFPSPGLKSLQDHLAVLRRQGAELSVKYGDKHPQMIALQSEQAQTTKKIEEAVRRFVENQNARVRTARQELAALEQAPATAPAAAPPDPSQDQRLKDLEARAQASRNAYQSALAESATEPPAAEAPRLSAHQLKPASPGDTLAAPDKPVLLGGAFGGSLLLSVLFALWLERPRNAFRTGADVEAATGAPNLSVVPMSVAKREGTGRKTRSSFSEGIRAIFAGIQLMRGGAPRVVMVTSSMPNEGKTSIAVALGRLVARGGGRVVLVDCDLRHPSVARLFGAHTMDAGLADVLVGNCDLATILRRDPLSPLEFLPAVGTSANSAELAGSQDLRNLIQVLRLHYDLVILDTPPVLPIADARLLSTLADKTIYVVEWNKTPREAVQSGLSMLRSAGAAIGGVVLNKADARRHAIFSGFDRTSDKYSGRYYAE